MSNGTAQHPNAPLTPEGRRRMVDCVVVRGWSVAATAERFQVDTKTVRKWRDRLLSEGNAGLWDRSSRPYRSPNRTPEAIRARVVEVRRARRWGAGHIGFEVGLASSTVQAILTSEGLGRLDHGDRATNTQAKAWLEQRRLIDSAHFQALVEAALHAVPRTRVKGEFAVAEAGLLERLVVAAFPDVTIPADEPEFTQEQLF